MVKFLLRKVVYVILLLWIVSLISFWLSRQVPGDEVLDYLSIDDRSYSAGLNPVEQRKAYQRVAVQRGLDLPPFYFSISPANTNDSINSILPLDDRKVVASWAAETGNAQSAYDLYKKLIQSLQTSCVTQNSHCSFINQLLSISDPHGLHVITIKIQHMPAK